RMNTIPEEYREIAVNVLKMQPIIIDTMREIVTQKINTIKIRIHGDYHLGQVLYTGKDFIIMDFEGEPARPLTERKLKRSPFRDVAGMIRSFHYAAYSTLFMNPTFRKTDLPSLDPWIKPLCQYMSGVFYNSYLKTASDAPFIPESKNEISILLRTFLLEKAVYELGYEMNNRPEWVIIPLRGIQDLIGNIAEK
ncbi:MAG: alpha-amylase, partial [Fibrobacter sp.]|nr:alpha-amylase [Fibrobacter sp.]